MKSIAHPETAVKVGEYWDQARWEWAPILVCPWPAPAASPKGDVGGAVGLSTAHIFSRAQNSVDFPTPEEPEYEPWPEDFTILRPDRDPPTQKPDRAAFVECYELGSLVLVKRVSAGGQRKGGGIRGKIATFTRQSRRRLMHTIAKIRRDLFPVFVTLTYPAVWPKDPVRWKRDLNVFWLRMSRKFPKAGFIWRLEFQGRGAPHYHLLVWGIGYKDLLEWVPTTWYEAVGSGDEKHLRAGTRVERIRSFKQVMRYASKELGKVSQIVNDYEGVGRWWGVYGRKNIPWALLRRWAVPDGDVVQIMRWMRRFAGLKSRSYKSLSVFADGSHWAEKIRAGPDPPGASFLNWSRGCHYGKQKA